MRRFILDLAVRGKLVEQNPQDEPAPELFRRIQVERTRLVRAGEIRKEKPLPPVEQDEVSFDTPAGWEWVRIRQVTSDRGQTVPDKDFTYIDVTAINKEVGRISEARILSPSEAPSRARKIVETGDVIYSCVRPYLLNIAIIDHDILPSPIASTAFAVLNGFGLVLPKYLWIALRSPFMIACVEAKMRGQAYPAINDSDFAQLPLPLPPLAEQHRIVAKADELMALCDHFEAAQEARESQRERLAAASLHRLNNGADASDFREHARFHLRYLARLTTRPEHISALRQTILNLAVQGKLVSQVPNDEPASILLKRLMEDVKAYAREHKIKPTRPEPIDEKTVPHSAPPGWTWTRLSSVFKVITDGDHQPPPKSEAGVAFLTIGNITTGRLDFSNSRFVPEYYLDSLAEYRRPSYGDILYTVVGATYGRPALVDTHRKFCVQRHIAILKPTAEIDAQFFCYLLASSLVYEQATQSITGIAQPTIPLRPLRNFLVLLPPLAEQHRIVAKVEELLNVCDRLEAQLTTAQTESRNFFEAVLNQVLGIRTPRAGELKMVAIQRSEARQEELEDTLSPKQILPKQDIQFMNSNPVKTVAQMIECLTALGGTATPERLLNVTGLGDDVDKFFDLLREGRDTELLSVPTGSNQVIELLSASTGSN